MQQGKEKDNKLEQIEKQNYCEIRHRGVMLHIVSRTQRIQSSNSSRTLSFAKKKNRFQLQARLHSYSRKGGKKERKEKALYAFKNQAIKENTVHSNKQEINDWIEWEKNVEGRG